MFGVAVRGVGAFEQIALLRARGHAGGRTDALHVDDRPPESRRSRRGPSSSFINEMPGPEVDVNARAPFQDAPITMPMAASSSSACRIRQLFLPVSGSLRYFSQKPRERVHHGSRRRDGIPGGDGGARVDAAERGRRVAVDQDLVVVRVHLFEMERQRALEMFFRVVVAEAAGPSGSIRAGLSCVENFSSSSCSTICHVDIEQRRSARRRRRCSSSESARADSRKCLVAHFGQGHAEEGHVVADAGSGSSGHVESYST